MRASLSEAFALGELSEDGALTQQQLGDRLGLEKSTVSRLAAGLERRGWLERVRDPADRRYVRLQLTTAGMSTARTLGAYFDQHHRTLLAALTPAERAGLRLGLGGLARALERHPTH